MIFQQWKLKVKEVLQLLVYPESGVRCFLAVQLDFPRKIIKLELPEHSGSVMSRLTPTEKHCAIGIHIAKGEGFVTVAVLGGSFFE